jgi:O-antigen/teichoic acid export membrane protein
MPHDLRRFARNFAFTFGGEGAQSAFHFILNLTLIRTLSTYDFGVFAIVFVLGGISLTYGNALVTVPAAVHMPRLKSPGAVRYQDVVFGSVALLLSVMIGTTIGLGLLVTLGRPEEALAGGLFVGAWTLRNHIRGGMLARRLMPAATLSDLTYTVSGIVLVTGFLYLDTGADRASVTLFALAAANAIAIAFALRAVGLGLRISWRRSVWRRYRGIWSDVAWSLFGTTTGNVQSQALMFLVAAFAGPAAYAPVAAGIVLFSPLRPAVYAFVHVIRVDFIKGLAQGHFRQLKVMLASLTALIVLGCAAVGAGIWFLWPLLEAHIYAGKYASASMPLIVTLAGLIAVMYLTYMAPMALVQAAGHFKTLALATTFGGLTGLASVVVLLKVTTVAWSLAGMVAGEVVCGVFLWTAALRILSRHTAPAWRTPASSPAEVRT